MSDEAAALIERLGLRPHPEGGHFAETYRHLPPQGGRGAATAIYYLLRSGEESRWHRLTDAVEIWAFHAGAPLALTLSADGLHIAPHRLGPDLAAGERPQVVVPAGCWQTARSLGDWTLVSCIVAPAFEYGSFELAPPGWRPGGGPDPAEKPEETMRLTDFEALSFDCYGTLIDWEAGILATLRPWAERHGLAVGDDALLAAFSRLEPEREGARPAALYPDILAEVFHALGHHFSRGVSDAEARAFGQSVKDWPAFPDSAAALAYLKRHYKLAILSNVDRASFAHSNRRLGVEFDLVVTAEDVGSYKPAPRNFEVLLERLAALGVAKERLLHTAESLFHDHVPAKHLGLATVWVNRRAGKGSFGATRAPEESVKPDWQVTTLAELADRHRQQSGG